MFQFTSVFILKNQNILSIFLSVLMIQACSTEENSNVHGIEKVQIVFNKNSNFERIVEFSGGEVINRVNLSAKVMVLYNSFCQDMDSMLSGELSGSYFEMNFIDYSGQVVVSFDSFSPFASIRDPARTEPYVYLNTAKHSYFPNCTLSFW